MTEMLSNNYSIGRARYSHRHRLVFLLFSELFDVTVECEEVASLLLTDILVAMHFAMGIEWISYILHRHNILLHN